MTVLIPIWGIGNAVILSLWSLSIYAVFSTSLLRHFLRTFVLSDPVSLRRGSRWYFFYLADTSPSFQVHALSLPYWREGPSTT